MMKLFLLLIFWINTSNAEILYFWSQLTTNKNISFRTIVSDEFCPSIIKNNKNVQMKIRDGKSDLFPNIVCEIELQKDTMEIAMDSHKIMIPFNNLEKIVVIGDTGCGINTLERRQICNQEDQWPFPKIANLAAKEKPSLIIHTGDYHYRAKQCKLNEGCSDNTGFGWESWEKDFFKPAKSLLTKAPWIMLRGNHEDCSNAWRGWERFFSLDAPSPNCQKIKEPILLEFDKQKFLILDSSSAIDSEKQFSNDNKNFEEFTLALHKAEELLERTDLNRSKTWMLTHKPLWTGAYMVHPFYYAEDHNSTFKHLEMKNLFEKISVIISGHTHLLELIKFDNSHLPIQLIIGNGGNDLITAYIPEEKTKVLQEKPLKRHFLIQEYGYVAMSNKKKKWLFNSHNRSGGKNLSCTIDTKKSNLNCN